MGIAQVFHFSCCVVDFLLHSQSPSSGGKLCHTLGVHYTIHYIQCAYNVMTMMFVVIVWAWGTFMFLQYIERDISDKTRKRRWSPTTCWSTFTDLKPLCTQWARRALVTLVRAASVLFLMSVYAACSSLYYGWQIVGIVILSIEG